MSSLPTRFGQVALPGRRSRLGELPPAMRQEAAHRLGKLALLLAGFFLVATLIRAAVGDRIGLHAQGSGGLVDLAMGFWSIASIALYAYSRRGDPQRVLTVGLFYEVWLCADLAGIEAIAFDFGTFPPRFSFIVLPLIVFPLVVPAPPRQRLLTTVLGLAVLPLANWGGRWMAGMEPPTLETLLLMLPTVLAAFAAYFASRLVYRLTLRVTEAQQLGSYELVDVLGGGGMGQVWRARHRFLVRPAAVKVVRPEALQSRGADALLRFEREAQATSVLRSPHTVQLYDFGQTDEGAFYYAMELLDGLDLDQLVNEHGPVSPARAIYLLDQMCASLAEAHAHGLVHRDVKPSNVFLARLGLEYDFVKVLDFGLVKPGGGGAGNVSATHADAATGTPAYLPPELALGGAVDGRTDLYGVGCVAYWLLTGRLVFDGQSPLEMAVAHVQVTPEPPSARTELPIPPALDELILACLAKDPADRPADAAAVRAALAAMPLAEPWTQESARRWWSYHVPTVEPAMQSLRPGPDSAARSLPLHATSGRG